MYNTNSSLPDFMFNHVRLFNYNDATLFIRRQLDEQLTLLNKIIRHREASSSHFR